MCSPLCICNGVIRSGSTWSFNVCRELYRLAAVQSRQPFASNYLDGAQLEDFITNRWAATPTAMVFKCHDIGPVAFATLQAGKAKAVYTYRDPRDCVASDLLFRNYTFERSVKRVHGTLEYLHVLESTSSVLLSRYEDMMADRPSEIRRIAKHLGIHADDAAIQKIDAKTNLQNCNTVCESLKDRPVDKVVRFGNHLADPFTQLHENHLNGGTIGRWKYEFSPEQISYATEFFAPMLLKLGYETPESLKTLLVNVAFGETLSSPISSPASMNFASH
jgi:hypothetical protein